MWFEFNISLLIFGLNRPSIVESGVLKSHTIIALLLLSAFKSFNICLIYLWPLMLDVCVFYLDELTPLPLYIDFITFCFLFLL